MFKLGHHPVAAGSYAANIGVAAASSGTELFDGLTHNPDAAEICHQAMVELTRGAAPGIAKAMDLRGARRVVDVGGGHGALPCAILEAHPGVEGVVFDLEHAREGALHLFAARGVAARASFIAGSCFDTAPPTADVYVLKSVIHDWDDARNLRLLGKCREMMDERARLFVVEPPAPAERGNPTLDWVTSFSDLNMLYSDAVPHDHRCFMDSGYLATAHRATQARPHRPAAELHQVRVVDNAVTVRVGDTRLSDGLMPTFRRDLRSDHS